MLSENTKINDFVLLDEENKEWRLSENLDKTLVLYFYPKDMTPGCSTQACNFRDNYDAFKQLDVNLVGISADSVESHVKFIEKKNLPFKLLSDPDYEVIKYFGVYGEKNVFGKKVVGIIRSTFIINKDMEIIKVYKKASPTKNTQEIIEFLSE